MCSEKICFCIPLHIACSILGIVSLILSAIMTVVSIVFLSLKDTDLHLEASAERTASAAEHKLQDILHVSGDGLRILLWIILAASLVATAASVSLIFGIRKRLAGLVLFYYGYGVYLTIMYLLGAILLLIGQRWALALLLAAIAVVLMNMLVIVHALYEAIQRGKEYGFSPHENLDESEGLTDNIVV